MRGQPFLAHWGRLTQICVGNLTFIGSDNGLSPGRRQAIIWTNYGILLIGPLGTNVSEISIEILTFSFKKKRLKVSSAKCRPYCLGLNVLIPLRSHRLNQRWLCVDQMLGPNLNEILFGLIENVSPKKISPYMVKVTWQLTYFPWTRLWSLSTNIGGAIIKMNEVVSNQLFHIKITVEQGRYWETRDVFLLLPKQGQ